MDNADVAWRAISRLTYANLRNFQIYCCCGAGDNLVFIEYSLESTFQKIATRAPNLAGMTRWKWARQHGKRIQTLKIFHLRSMPYFCFSCVCYQWSFHARSVASTCHLGGGGSSSGSVTPFCHEAEKVDAPRLGKIQIWNISKVWLAEREPHVVLHGAGLACDFFSKAKIWTCQCDHPANHIATYVENEGTDDDLNQKSQAGSRLILTRPNILPAATTIDLLVGTRPPPTAAALFPISLVPP